MTKIISALVSVFLVAAASAANAEDLNRYVAIAVPPAQSSTGSKIIILDAREGHLWQW
jgi:hypothetical protein